MELEGKYINIPSLWLSNERCRYEYKINDNTSELLNDKQIFTGRTRSDAVSIPIVSDARPKITIVSNDYSTRSRQVIPASLLHNVLENERSSDSTKQKLESSTKIDNKSKPSIEDRFKVEIELEQSKRVAIIKEKESEVKKKETKKCNIRYCRTNYCIYYK